VQALKYVPVVGLDEAEEICLAAVQQDGNAPMHVKCFAEICLKYLPVGLAGAAAIFLTVVQQNGNALEYVPKTLRTQALCVAAVQQNVNASEYVPQRLREICLAAVQ